MTKRLAIVCVLCSLVGTAAADYKKLATQPKLASNDTIPSGERSSNSNVVTGDGFRFQVPPDAVAVEVATGVTGYQFADKGFDGSTYAIVTWATKAPFKGDIKALLKRESDAAKKAGAEVGADGLDFDTGGISVEGKYVLRGGRRAEVAIGDKTELRAVYLHKGAAYVWHCESAKAAWRNAKSSCLVRSVTLHIAPPKK